MRPSSKGNFRAVLTTAPGDVISYRRGDALVLVNTRTARCAVAVTGFEVDGARDLLANPTQHGRQVTLPAYGAVVLRR